jgi:UDP-2,4-diacetamido-2,4,6-trideoxy-beta-L-altropyranose hydrolase
MLIVIRTDASLEIGTGHVMRCVTLAKQLEKAGANITFVCRNFPGNSNAFIKSQGFDIHTLTSHVNQNYLQWMNDFWKQDAEETKLITENLNKKIDLLIVDHYSLDAKWERDLHSTVKYIMAIDDLANRPHYCDLLLDQNYYLNMQERYKGLVQDSCIQLLGPNYVLLRDEFLTIDTEKIKRDGSIKRILVFFGGTDPTGETMKTLEAVKELNRSDIKYNVVVGAANPQKEKIEQICGQFPNITFHCQINNIAELMLKADLAIGAGGATTWERCFLGLPSILIIVADNQNEVTQAVAEDGAVYCLGESSEVTKMSIGKEIKEICGNFTKLKLMIQSCRKIVKPNVVKEQLVMKKIMELLK